MGSALAALLLLAGSAAAQDPMISYAPTESPAQASACYQMCKLSLTKVLDGDSKKTLGDCETRATCYARLSWGPDHGAIAEFKPGGWIDDFIDRFIKGQSVAPRFDGAS